MPDTRPIGLFDSGVGGLSILKELKKFLPSENFIFLADQKNIPYGAKGENDLKKICEKVAKFLKNQNIKLLVVACNTATCYTIDHLRNKFKIPIVGTVPAIKTASVKTKNKKIAVLSSPATSKSKYLQGLISQFADNQDVLNVSCANLENAIEEASFSNITSILKKHLKGVKSFQADTVVLGCTHYPLVKDLIAKELSKKVEVVDSSRAISRRVRFLLSKNSQLSNRKIKDVYFTTLDPLNFQKTASFYMQEKITANFARV